MKKKEKYLKVSFDDRSEWLIPAKFIAEHMAAYYAERDTGKTSGKEYERVFREEFVYTINNDDEIIDWAANNMNWDDVSHVAEPIPKEPVDPDYSDEWGISEMEVIER